MALDLSLTASIGPLAVSVGTGGVALSLGLPTPLSPAYTALTLDNIEFAAFEVPEKFGPLGGEQVLARHDFPGGARTIQTFGAFPPDITWTGIFTGPTAGDREQAVDRLRVTAKLVVLRYGRWAWQGYVEEFEAIVQTQFLIGYRIKFCPQKDLSGVATNPNGASSAEASMASDQQQMSNATDPNTQTQPLPADMMASTDEMNTAITQSLQNSSGSVADISQPDNAAIQAQNQVVQDTAAPYIAGTDAQAASASLDAANYSQAATNVMLSVDQPVAQVRSINPNLFALAAIYYGDPTQWQVIANANGLCDPQPIGEFLIQIPPPASTAAVTAVGVTAL